jgi:hypothetical protein
LFSTDQLKTYSDKLSDNFNIEQFLKSYFESQHEDKRNHRGVRKEYSLPVIAVPSGGYRILRKTPEDDNVIQLVAIDGLANEGFSIRETVQFNKPVILTQLLDHKRLAFTENYEASTEEICYFDEGQQVEVPEELKDIIVRLKLFPNSKDRFEIEVGLSFDNFYNCVIKNEISHFESELKKIEKEYKKETEDKKKKTFKKKIDGIKNNISTYKKYNKSFKLLPVELKIENKDGFLESFKNKLGKPRSNLFINKLDNDIVFSYIVESTNSEMKQLFNQSYLK